MKLAQQEVDNFQKQSGITTTSTAATCHGIPRQLRGKVLRLLAENDMTACKLYETTSYERLSTASEALLKEK